MTKGKDFEVSSVAAPQARGSVTRRGFIGTLVGTSMAIAAGGLLAGCSSGDTGASEDPGVAEAAPANREFSTYQYDVVVVGGGICGMIAARKAVEDGAKVVLVDKGPFGHSGASGINWGHTLLTNEFAEDEGEGLLSYLTKVDEGIGDQAYVLSVCKHVKEAKAIQWNNAAGAVPYHDLEGNPPVTYDPAAITAQDGCFPRIMAQDFIRTGTPVLDRTMVVDVVLSPEGAAAGVLAIDLRTGEAMVIRAKSVILATGSFCWTYGWTGNGAISISGPECTGDGHGIMMGLGAQMKHMEVFVSSFYSKMPSGMAYGMGNVGMGQAGWKFARNKNGEWFTEYLTTNGGLGGPRMVAKAIYDGEGTDDGGIFVDCSDPSLFNRYTRRAPENIQKFTGYEVPDMCPIYPQHWETAGRPILDTTGQTIVPNLYFAGNGEWNWRGCSSAGSIGSGHLVGESAAASALATDVPAVDWERVAASLEKCYEALEREAEGGVRADEVYHNIQKAMEIGSGMIRDADMLNQTIAELERIKAEEIPNMVVSSKSKVFNTEWRHALEVPNMWACSMASAQAALVRTETRGCIIRLDYPSVDNENWLKDTVVTPQADGTFVAEAGEFDSSIISLDEIREILANDISFFDDTPLPVVE